MTAICPCCGQSMNAGRAPIEALREAPMTHGQRAIVAALVAAYPRSVDAAFLVDAVYSDDPDGGPLDPAQTIRVQISHLRRSLPAYGWTIPQGMGGSGNKGRYRLEPMP